jgi:peptidoglycan-associated lipoprotein
MSHPIPYQPGRMAKLARNPLVIALVAGLALASCAKNKKLNSADDLGLNANNNNSATPGSQQDFTVNVGDRIFFDTDSSSIRADAAQTLNPQAQWLNH